MSSWGSEERGCWQGSGFFPVSCTSQEVHTQHLRLYFVMSIDMQINWQYDVNFVSLTGVRITVENVSRGFELI